VPNLKARGMEEKKLEESFPMLRILLYVKIGTSIDMIEFMFLVCF
jgi:hypothetical protein